LQPVPRAAHAVYAAAYYSNYEKLIF